MLYREVLGVDMILYVHSSLRQTIGDVSCLQRHDICDGHAHGSSAGLVDWATVCLIVIIDVDTHRSCLRHRSIYSIMAGKLCAKCSAAKPHGQF